MTERVEDIIEEMRGLRKFGVTDEPMCKSIGIVVARYADRIEAALKV